MKSYNTLFFDLFDTVINFNFTNLPSIELNGVRSRTTSTEVYSVFNKYHPEISFEEFYLFFIESYHQFQDMKLIDYKEFPNRDRFRLMLSNMNLDTKGPAADELADGMVAAHMDGLASAVEFPDGNQSLLNGLREAGYRMAIVSNFDYAPAAYSLIEKFGLRRFFEKIVISEEVGWRKPNPIIFRSALELLGAEPDESIFIGDNFKADVEGSKAVGMDAVWLNSRNENTEGLHPAPDYIISSLPALTGILL